MSLSQWRPTLPHLGLGACGGLLYSLSIPKADISLLAWLCLVPLLLPLRYKLPQRGPIALGLGWGIAAGIGRVYWLTETLSLYGNIPTPLGILTNGLLILYLALYPIAFVVLSHRLNPYSPLFGWATASLWTLLEWIQTWLFSGFPWQLLGYSQYKNGILIQIAALGGVYGISFVLTLGNTTLVQLLDRPSRKWSQLLPPGILIGLLLVYGWQRRDNLAAETGPSLQIGVVQGNFSQDQKWQLGPNQTTQRYLELSREIGEDNRLDLVLFPETALPFDLDHPNNAPLKQQITDLAQELSSAVLVGSPAHNSQGAWVNRASLFDKNGNLSGYSDKVHLVPFGEYLPFPWLFSYMQGLTEESGAFAPGDGHKPITLEKGINFGIFICYESIFPAITRTLVQQGASFLVNTTNDAWFGQSAAPYQHLAMVAIRAVETGRPIIRAANTGISGVITPGGEMGQLTPLFETQAFVCQILPRSELTLYVRFGPLWLISCVILLALAYFFRDQQREAG